MMKKDFKVEDHMRWNSEAATSGVRLPADLVFILLVVVPLVTYRHAQLKRRAFSGPQEGTSEETG